MERRRVFVAGHRGLVGSAIVRRLASDERYDLLTATRGQLDLRDQPAVERWFDAHRPHVVYLVAGTVGGIWANATRPAEFVYDNLLIHANVVHAAYRTGVERLLYLGSSCIYPRASQQPIAEDQLLSGPLEPTNEAYAIAKIAGIKLCAAYRQQYGCDFFSAIPTNLYGPGDNFDVTSGHVIPALVRRFDLACQQGLRKVTVWGSGTPRREFLHVDDLADACVFLIERFAGQGHVNIGTGEEVSIRELAEIVRSVVYPEAEIELDAAKPDGMPRKLLDSSRLHALGWRHRIGLREGIRSTYEWLRDALGSGTVRGLAEANAALGATSSPA